MGDISSQDIVVPVPVNPIVNASHQYNRVVTEESGYRKMIRRKSGSYAGVMGLGGYGLLELDPSSQGTSSHQISFSAPAGRAVRWTSTANIGDNAGLIWSALLLTYRGWNPWLAFRFRIDTATNQRTWIGFTNHTAAHPGGDTDLNTFSGIIFGKRSTDTANWIIMYNDGSATALYTAIGGAPDNTVHEVRIWADDSVPAWYVKLDTGTPITISGSQIPAQNTGLTIVKEVETSEAVLKIIDIHAIDIESDF